ncbi:MAG: hypothetical protein DRI01_06025 [Chloroflexi bacterium]|nr:MAG: hypothetical protein DRI01_06025 [Chloroflexota bacterium]
MDALEKLSKSWPIIKWLDDARWSSSSSGSIIPGDVFESLEERGKILTHWLCYITDQQRPYEQVWNQGGPVFAEVIAEYLSSVQTIDHVLDLLSSYTVSTEGMVDEYVSQRQKLQELPIRYTPRFGMHQLSIARSLGLLLRYQKSIATYLSANERFLLRVTGEYDSITWRMAFLLYLLSYDQIRKGMLSFHSQQLEFRQDLQRKDNELQLLLHDMNQLENRYQKWVRWERFHKRLWAALRDYLKPGSYFEVVFMKCLEGTVGTEILSLLNRRYDILSWLELPGDTWNLQFSWKLFGANVASPQELRNSYIKLREMGIITGNFYPEQFDISFDFSPRMCDKGNEDLCPFRRETIIAKYCVGRDKTSDKYCPVTMVLCGYKSRCHPGNCPVMNATFENLCAGCRIQISVV